MSVKLIDVSHPKNLKETINRILAEQAEIAKSVETVDGKIPTQLSQLLNDVNFITNTVDNLINYYSKADINTLIASIKTFSAQVVSSLPTTNISPTTIYLIRSADPVAGNSYDEYMYINLQWELIGNTRLNMSYYYTKTEVDTKFAEVDTNFEKVDTALEEVNTKLTGIDALLDNINGEVV